MNGDAYGHSLWVPALEYIAANGRMPDFRDDITDGPLGEGIALAEEHMFLGPTGSVAVLDDAVTPAGRQ